MDAANKSADGASLAALRRAAAEFVAHSWSIFCGTYLTHTGWQGRSNAAGLQPIHDDWPTALSLGVNRVEEWWVTEPYSVLLACGHGIDCLEVPAPTGPRVLKALRVAGIHPPAMVTPVKTLMLFVRADPMAYGALVSASARSAGSWAALPPTGQGHGDGYRWLNGWAPCDTFWHLPELPAVYQVIVDTVSTVSAAPWNGRIIRGEACRRR